jgi:nicotinate phosphoribosyltransferase
MHTDIFSYLRGFDATSNVLAGKIFGIPIKGTLAHSYVSSFSTIDNLNVKVIIFVLILFM